MRTLPLVVLLSSCTTAHVVVPPHPAKTATEAEREAYRDRFTKDPTRLKDGTTLEDLADIAPAVDDDSVTARAARSASLDSSLTTAAAIGAGIGLNLGWMGLIASGVSQKDGQDTPASQFFLVASGVSAVAGVALLTTGIAFVSFQSDAEETAKASFAKDLDAALALPPRDEDATELARTVAPTTSTAATPTTPTTTTTTTTTTTASTTTTTTAPTTTTVPPTTTTAPTTTVAVPRSTTSAVRATSDSAHAPASASSPPTKPPPTSTPEATPPMHVVVRAGSTKIAEFDAGPDGALVPTFVDDAQREIAGDVGGIFGVRASALFACFMRAFPKAGAKQKAAVHLGFKSGRVTSSKSKDNACAAKALSRGSIPLSRDSFEIDVDIENTAGPFVSPRCRRAIGTDAFAASCKGLFASPDTVDVVMALGGDEKLELLAEGFREDVCPSSRFALCKRRSVEGVSRDVLAGEVRAIEERYVRQLTDDDAIVKAALDAVSR